MSNSLFSKEMQEQLKSLKSDLKKGRETPAADPQYQKPTEPVALPSKKQVQKTVSRLDSEHINDDKVLFMQAMAGVTPIADKNTVSTVNKPTKTTPNATTMSKRAAAQGADKAELEGNLSDMQALLNPVSGDAYLMYKNPTLQTSVFSQLKQGKLRWYDAVDIHGCTIDEARSAIMQLLFNATNSRETVVKIVHGKGTDAVLKTCVNGWLRQLPDVLAFCSAPPKDGGNGAVLVLLKKNKESKKTL